MGFKKRNSHLHVTVWSAGPRVGLQGHLDGAPGRLTSQVALEGRMGWPLGTALPQELQMTLVVGIAPLTLLLIAPGHSISGPCTPGHLGSAPSPMGPDLPEAVLYALSDHRCPGYQITP